MTENTRPSPSKPPSRPSRNPLDDIADHHEQLAVSLRLAISKARQIATSPSPVSWKTALRAAFSRAGKRNMASDLSARHTDLLGLAAELRRLLHQSEMQESGAAAQDRQNPQHQESALRADRAVAQTRRWRPEAQRWLQAIETQLASVERNLSKLE